MQPLRYFTLDVFTNRPFSGNPLAVFPDAEGLDSQLMQTIARELNLSETVFIGQSTAVNRFAMRIFTPAQEMPFAGHPTIGTALLLEQLNLLDITEPSSQPLNLVLEQGVGDIAVTIDPLTKTAQFKTAQLPQIEDSCLDQASAAELLCLQPDQILTKPFIASCGYPFQMIELRDLQALAEAKINTTFWQEKLALQPVPELYMYAKHAEENQIRTRMFAPAAGITEDPATGSAAAALAGAIAQKQLQEQEQLQEQKENQQIQILQGVEMNRPSHIEATVSIQNKAITGVYISGQAVRISTGEINI